METNKWKEFVEKNLFSSKDEFHQLPYLSNSPEIKIKSIIEFPVTRHETKEKAVYAKNQYVDGVLRYLNIEEGLWLLGTTIQVNKNIIGKALYSNQKSDYYFLSFSAFEYEFPPVDTISSSPKKLLSKCWTFYKPKTQVNTYFYNNTFGNFCNIAFTKEWAIQNIYQEANANSDMVFDFLNDETGFLTWLAVSENLDQMAKLVWNAFVKKPTEDLAQIKNKTQTLIQSFFDEAIAGHRIQNYEPLKTKDYYNIARAEKILLQNLSEPFLGVDAIATVVNVSATKLKRLFKMVYGFSMLQYHKEKNLQLAEQLISNSDIQIQHIAAITGYESASKFSATFKKRFGKLPLAYKKS